MTLARYFENIISADSHVYEPADLWWNTLGGKFGERTPRTVINYQGHQGKYLGVMSVSHKPSSRGVGEAVS